MTAFESNVMEIVRKIPSGKVSTYQAIASLVGKPRAVRAVGNALAKNPYSFVSSSTSRSERVPCHRVVRSNGELGGFAGNACEVEKKIALLREEGIRVKNGKIVQFQNYLCNLYARSHP
jgi:methylated-DNA-[protein]-cysteine S-methyltransferase